MSTHYFKKYNGTVQNQRFYILKRERKCDKKAFHNCKIYICQGDTFTSTGYNK